MLHKVTRKYQNHQIQPSQEIVEIYLNETDKRTHKLLKKNVVNKVFQQTRDKLLFKNQTKKCYIE